MHPLLVSIQQSKPQICIRQERGQEMNRLHQGGHPCGDTVNVQELITKRQGLEKCGFCGIGGWSNRAG